MRNKTIDLENLEKLFSELYFELNDQSIRAFHRKNPSSGLAPMFNNFYNFCFFAYVNSDKIEYISSINLSFIHYKEELKGYGVEVPINYEFANELVFRLAVELTKIDEDLEVIETFNTLQNYRINLLESSGYITFDPNSSPKGSFLSVSRGLVPVWNYKRKLFYKHLMSPIVDHSGIFPDSNVYLMLDDKTGLFKIGHSKNPPKRERTLQSEKPETYLIASWSAPKNIERTLHQKFSKNRKRGEWFKLTISQLDEIKDFMNTLY